jgi:hypothetical protein
LRYGVRSRPFSALFPNCRKSLLLTLAWVAIKVNLPIDAG